MFDASNDVWERRGYDALSARFFAFMVCFWTAAGVALSALGAGLTIDWKPVGYDLLFLSLGVLAVSIIGIIIALKSDNPVISLLGYAMVAFPFGLMTGPIVALYTTASVFKVLIITTGMSVGLGLIGALWPRSLESWGGWLFGALLVLLLGQFVTIIAGLFGMPVKGAMTALDWIGVALFSAYIIYDLNRAMRVERTHDNAIDCALAIYLDVYNLFIRLLRLMGDRK